jgi:hypothetical protein
MLLRLMLQTEISQPSPHREQRSASVRERVADPCERSGAAVDDPPIAVPAPRSRLAARYVVNATTWHRRAIRRAVRRRPAAPASPLPA